MAGNIMKSGRLEVATAIASTSHLVSVDPTATPFVTVPPDLFDRKFNNAKVGIDDNQMRVFKENLRELLPEITTDIGSIPENSNRIAFRSSPGTRPCEGSEPRGSSI